MSLTSTELFVILVAVCAYVYGYHFFRANRREFSDRQHIVGSIVYVFAMWLLLGRRSLFFPVTITVVLVIWKLFRPSQRTRRRARLKYPGWEILFPRGSLSVCLFALSLLIGWYGISRIGLEFWKPASDPGPIPIHFLLLICSGVTVGAGLSEQLTIRATAATAVAIALGTGGLMLAGACLEDQGYARVGLHLVIGTTGMCGWSIRQSLSPQVDASRLSYLLLVLLYCCWR